ncbi:peroxin 14 17 [Colletotrichum sojae]|uniref:Peroxisomal membrane protein PEX14 n=1 Tax=Colletotrichum sojae TaxID=2175907 RepID=A0A8H6JXW5_9PEZI|nr:peroxin 14 17 [Colletotrichum sojae]
MSDSDDSRSGIPAWQREQQSSAAVPQLPEPASQDATGDAPEDKLEVARRFLQDDEIKNEPTERKEEFLRTKGLTSSEIAQLLDSEPAPEAQLAQTANPQTTESTPAQAAGFQPQSPPQDEISLPRQNDSPPVITYPEFLTKPTRPPPLVTANAIVNTLCAFAGLSTLLYGTSKFVVAPMVETQTEARVELHATTAEKLSALVSKLESTVSEIPASNKSAADAQQQQDESSEFDDPTELFHRDIGTQTSFPSTPRPEATGFSSTAVAESKTPGERHHVQLSKMKLHAQQLRDTCVTEAEDLAHAKTEMDLLKDDLVQLAYPSPREYTGGLYGYGSRSNEPDDEIKKAKDNIRRVKGVLLSTRNFPASVR